MKVKLIQPHTHAGEQYEPGAELEVGEQVAGWLVEQGIASLEPKSRNKPQKTQQKES